MEPLIAPFDGKHPQIDPSAFVAPNAVIIGDVTIGPESGIWYGCVLRGDEFPIVIGARTNIQDLSLCHETSTVGPLIIGDDVTVGHRAILHGCTIADRCLIGMGAVVMDGAKIGEGSIVAAGALVTERMEVPPGSLVAGLPAKIRRELTDDDLALIEYSSGHYVHHRQLHKQIFEKK